MREGHASVVQNDADVARRPNRSDLMAEVRDDLAYAARSLRRTPAVSATIILTLALGLGVNAAMFSFLDQVFARQPVGVDRPESVRRLWWATRIGDARVPIFWAGHSYPGYTDVVAAIGERAKPTIYFGPSRQGLQIGGNPLQAPVLYAGAGYFSMLGVTPAAGRLFTDEENRPGLRADVAVVSDAFWRRAMGADPAALGKTLSINNQQRTVIGILRPLFSGVDLDAADIWLPIGSLSPAGAQWWLTRRSGFHILLQPAVGVDDRQIEDRATLALRERDRTDGRPVDSLNVARLGGIVEARGPGEAKQEVKVATRLAGVAAIVLLIACANVVNLLLARAVHRRREIAVRLALGISRARLMRLLVVESVLLAAIAAVAAVAAAWWGGTLLRKQLLPDVQWSGPALHWRVIAFAVIAALLAGLVAGLVPAWQASRPDLAGALKAGEQEAVVLRSRLRFSLVVAQAALSLMLLAGAGLFVKSLQNVREVDIGFDASRLVFAGVGFPTSDSSRDANVRGTLEQIGARLRRLPGVERLAFASAPPMSDWFTIKHFTDAKTPPQKPPQTTYVAVSPDYFATTGIRIVRGTGFPPTAGAAMPRVVVVNEAMAGVIWPGEDPIGRCVRFNTEDAPCYTVSGIVENAFRDHVVEDPRAQFYLPLDNMPTPRARAPQLVIRAGPENTAAIVGQVRQAIHDAWPAGNPRIRRLSDAVEPEYRPWRLGATLFTTFGLLALIIAAVGIFSTVSYGVSQRTREFGVRVALGAQMRDVLGQVIGEGLRTVAVGIVVGVGLALAAGRMIASLLYGIKPNNPAVIVLVALILLAVAAIAALAPAWRAARVDPVDALRAE